jgi:tRNA G10  N-methylase Trm11
MTETFDQNTAYVFIAGKNWKLSLAEIISYLRARSCTIRIIEISKPFFLIEAMKPLDPTVIDELGGTIKIARFVTSIPPNIVTDAFAHKNKQARTEMHAVLSKSHAIDEILVSSPKKLVFGVSVYLDDSRLMRFSREIHRFLGSKLKETLAAKGIRSSFMGFSRYRKLPQLSHVEVLKKGLVEKSAEILFCVGGQQAFVAHTVAVHNPFEFQKRDVGRPVQRRIFSIPPRLAKIMVNLASCLPGMVLLDPFCGVGTILQEALLNGAHVIGVDIDQWCVKAAEKNLEWIKTEYKLKRGVSKVLVGDSRRLSSYLGKESVDCIVTEPDLGPPLRHVPTEGHANVLVRSLMPMYAGFMESAYETMKRNSSLVFVTPYFRTRGEVFVSLNVDQKASSIGFKKINAFRETLPVGNGVLWKELQEGSGSFIDIAERHMVGREIHVFRKI